MGLLDEPGLDRLVAAGCTACGGSRLVFRTFIDGRVALLGGDPVAGPPTWVHDGEKFVDGVFEVACEACKHVVFGADVCPRCHAPGGLAVALGTRNALALPSACPSCDADELHFVALFPARAVHDGKRADRPRTSTELHDPGAHGLRASCPDCGPLSAPPADECPLCAARAPLRPRPGA